MSKIAPEGHIWVCHACGKTSKDRYGYTEKHPQTAYGWDASCVMNSSLYKIEDLVWNTGYVVSAVKEGAKNVDCD